MKLVSKLREIDPERAEEIDINNKRRVVRALGNCWPAAPTAVAAPVRLSVIGGTSG